MSCNAGKLGIINADWFSVNRLMNAYIPPDDGEAIAKPKRMLSKQHLLHIPPNGGGGYRKTLRRIPPP
ncbi:hypothetical protein PCCS19_12380 [Paenibacillus sp. CCS19]|nr:hypothetical protein PCCS19_12380 [Paenibacillus cellulosilyticus]